MVGGWVFCRNLMEIVFTEVNDKYAHLHIGCYIGETNIFEKKVYIFWLALSKTRVYFVRLGVNFIRNASTIVHKHRQHLTYRGIIIYSKCASAYNNMNTNVWSVVM